MYEAFFGLSEKPFPQTWHPEYLFLGASHRQAIALFKQQLEQENRVYMITGEPGLGKTTLLRHLCDSAGPRLSMGMIGRQHYSNGTLMQWINGVFRLPHHETRQQPLRNQLLEFLARQKSQHNTTVLIIDDAQQLTQEALQVLEPLLADIRQGQLSLHLILAGPVHLPEHLLQATFTTQIDAQFCLQALSRDETHEYITQHLHSARAATTLFDAAALDAVYEHTRGVPRSINLLCDSALVFGLVADSSQINTALVNRVVEERKSGHLFDTLKKAEALAPDRGTAKAPSPPTPKAKPRQTPRATPGTAAPTPPATPRPTATSRHAEGPGSGMPHKPLLAAGVVLITLIGLFTLSGTDEQHTPAPAAVSTTDTQSPDLSYTEQARLEHEAAKRAMAEAEEQARQAAAVRSRLTQEAALAQEQAQRQAREAAAQAQRRQQQREASLAAARQAEEAARIEAEKKARELAQANAKQQQQARQAAIVAAQQAENKARKAAELRAQQERETALAQAQAAEEARAAAARQAQQQQQREAAILAAQQAEDQARQAARLRTQQEHEAALARTRAEDAARNQLSETEPTPARDSSTAPVTTGATEEVRFTVSNLKGSEAAPAQAGTGPAGNDSPAAEKVNFAPNPCSGPAAKFMSTCK